MAQPRDTGPLPPDSMLMEFRLVSVLGVGGTAITYHATDTRLGNDVAIREYVPAGEVARIDGATVGVIYGEQEEDFREGRARFLAEALALAGFSHPNVIRVHRCFEAHGTAYAVMDREEGETLRDWLSRNPLPAEEAVKAILAPILDGLGKAHDAGLLHRDIKPDSILVRADGSPVLLTFGAAHAARGPMMRTLTRLVKPGYAPLEQYTPKSQQGPWSDVYALGGVAYSAVTGENPPDVLSRMREDNVAGILARHKDRFADGFLDAIAWALRLDEKQRPRSIAEWRARLLGEAPATAAHPASPAAGPLRTHGGT